MTRSTEPDLPEVLPRSAGAEKGQSLGAKIATAIGRYGPAVAAVCVGSLVGGASAVAQATPAPSADERELLEKVGRLVDRNFGGDVRAAFNHYAGADAEVSRNELSRLLEDAGVGNWFTRGAWVDGIMERMDTDHNGKISWTEFNAVMNPTAPSPTR